MQFLWFNINVFYERGANAFYKCSEREEELKSGIIKSVLIKD